MNASISVAAIENGVCVKITGSGTMHESTFVRDLILRALNESPAARAAVDLSDCTYLDSTLLGCLISIHRKAGPRWTVAAKQDVVRKVLAAARLDKLLPIVDAPPPVTSAYVPVDVPQVRAADMKPHLYECHARLAEVEGPLQPVFARIAEQMKQEMSR
jgi:anti-anti-sigma factor